MTLPRLRMFAGPNGSGKSTIKNVVPPALLGVFLNPDEIEKDIAQFGFLDVRDYGVETTREEIIPFFINSPLLIKAGLDEEAGYLRFTEITDGHDLEMKCTPMPLWFQRFVWNKIYPPA